MHLPFCLPDTRPVPDSRAKPNSPDILVVGSFIEHNKKGLRSFLDGAWPALKAAKPGIKLTVCGRVGEILQPDPNITWHQCPSSLIPHYHDASIVLLTTVSGTGIKIKAIEALANGCCIVTHPHSVAGIPFAHGIHGEIVSDLAAASPPILKLLGDVPQQEAYREAAHALFRENFHTDRGRDLLAKNLLRPSVQS